MKSLFYAAALAAGLSCAPAWAEFDNYLKIDGIDGEATAKGHERWIDISQWSWGLSPVKLTSASGSGGAEGRNKVVFQDFVWAQQVDASVVPLFLGVATGTNYKKVTLDVVRTSGKANSESFFQMIFSDVVLSSLTTSGGDDINPNAAGSLNAVTVKLRYRKHNDKGTYDDWIEGAFTQMTSEVQFSGDPKVIQGLFESGGQVSLAAIPPAVPEPANWALMAAGALLVLGTTVVRRRHGS